ncbi:MAG: UDP-N-acetylmuramate dehydrogenase [Planctomycetota bacterium]|nr:UDP-N-acetylmuramate dehydrogenase [Planctomycetota bacterium]MDA1158977.1 UDP-N-acetylmuramate dehydrogenase [Planctomycetota bacterium]
MSLLEQFSEITEVDQPLAPLTWMKTGGVAQYVVTPRNRDELREVVTWCHENETPIHVLGGGSNVLVRDDGVSGVVLRLADSAFGNVEVEGTTVRAGATALLSHVISESVMAGLAGLESLVGIPGTIGGALRGNAGGRNGDIGQFVSAVTVLTAKGEQFTRREDELSFTYRSSSLNELVILEGEFQLHEDSVDEITRRMKKLWIMKKATQPLASQSAGCIFRNPRGLSSGALIEQAGLKGTRVGGAEVSDRHANFIVTYPEATSADVLRLIDLIQSKVSEQFGVELELEIQVW